MTQQVAFDVAGLWQDYKAKGDVEDRNRLVEHYLDVVKWQAKLLMNRLPDRSEAELDDLISVGVFGLLDAIEAFDPERGFKFETFCLLRVRGAMLDWLRDIDWVPRLEREKERRGDVQPKRMTSLFRKFDHRSEYSVSNSKEDREADIYVRRAGKGTGHRPQQTDLRRLVTTGLSTNERLIVILYYYEDMTMDEIASVLGLSESRVSQLHSRVVERLRERLAGRAEEFLAAV